MKPAPARGPAAPGIRFTSLQKPLWPAAGGPILKAEYLSYLRAVAPAALPHMRGRPLVLTRYPHGAGRASFYQKNLPPSAPPWLPRFGTVTGAGRRIQYLVPQTVADLLWVGQQCALEFHPWLSRVEAPGLPDRAVIDLDPMAPAGFEEARAVARAVGRLLCSAGVRGWLKTSGATGLHVFIPVRPERPYAEVSAGIRSVGQLLQRLMPDLVSLERSRERRGPRVYFDYPQNGSGKTLCGAYSPRPLPGAPVSLPIGWPELDAVRPGDWTVRTVPERLVRQGDAWADLPGAPYQELDVLRAFCEATLAGRHTP